MTSFGYRLNPRYAIKECSSCGALYTGDFCCSKGNVEDKILVPKLPKNYARFPRCGHPVDGPYCQGCALLRNTNVVNAPREPFIVKQDHGVNSSQNLSSNQRHCFHVKDVLGDGEIYQRCTCMRCGSGLCKGLCLICKHNQQSLNTSPSISNRPAFYDDDDDDMDYTIAITPVLSTEEPDNSLSMGDEHLDTIPVTESDEVIKSSVENLVPILSESEGIPEHMCDVPFHDNSPPLGVLKDQFENFSDSNDEFSSIDDDSFSIDNIDYVEASPLDSELVSSEVREIAILKVGGIYDDILLTIKDDILRKKLLNVNLLIAKIEALNDNPTLSSNFKTKSSFTSLNSLLEETNTFDNSLPEFETFCFDVEEISSGSTTTHFDISLPEYEVFYDDHVREISSGSPTTHSDSPLYESFIFDLSINPFPPADRSDFYEFADELIHFISPP
uniref:Uncharacterized protein n=1 Tax=Tanacetum cinerariifolium TaxID=118510 RepID=A0A6L2JSQ3_TANCI|nr:hypothetical protein [Tanacetum cinerariifolium]